MDLNESKQTDETALESWKEIAAYLRRQVKTVQRWEKEEKLPVHRHSHKSRSSVYAYPSEIDAWRAGRRVAPEPAAVVRPSWRPVAIGVTTLLCLVMVGNGIRPTIASAETKQNRQIWVAGANQDPSESVPSADGRFIGFTDWNTGELGIRDLTTGQSRILTNGAGWATSRDYAESSAISPDGRQIAYSWFVTSKLTYELRLMPLNGGPSRTLYRGEGKREYPKVSGWTPDGKEVLVVRALTDRTSQLALISTQDGSVRVLKSFTWRNLNARLSPDGRFVAYDSPTDDKTAARDIFVIAADGSRETPVVQHPAMDMLPQWTPDGSRILFLSDRTGTYSLWSVEMDNGRTKGPATLVKAEVGGIQPLGITRTGALQYIAPGSKFSNIYSAEFGSDLKAVKAPALATERFLNSNVGSQVSADGGQLAYISSRSSGAVIVIRELKTGQERDIKVPFPLWTRYGVGPMWFPDKRSVLVSSRNQQGGIGFYRVDVRTGATELLHRVFWTRGYQLSPDGKSIFYSEQPADAHPASRLVRFDLDSRQETELKTGEGFIAVAISPDGKHIAYSVDASPAGIGYIAVMPASGGESQEVFRGSRWLNETLYNTLAWTPDQKFLVFGQSGDRDPSLNVLWRVPASGGQPEHIGVSMQGSIKGPQIQSDGSRPDGNRIFFTRIENAPNEVWTLENFLPALKEK